MIKEIFVINWMELFDVFLRAFISLMTLFLITKALGKKQVSQLSLFDYVIGISIGNFAAEMTINLDSHYLNGVLAVVVFGGVAYIISHLTMKSMMLRRIFMGTPTILIQEGKLLEDGLREVKFDVNDLLSECRGNGYFDISEIEYAIMESNGKISILPKKGFKPVTSKEMNVKTINVGLCSNVIIDSNIMTDNLRLTSKSTEWLHKELKKQGYDDLSDILLATIDVSNNLVIYERNKHILPKTTLE